MARIAIPTLVEALPADITGSRAQQDRVANGNQRLSPMSTTPSRGKNKSSTSSDAANAGKGKTGNLVWHIVTLGYTLILEGGIEHAKRIPSPGLANSMIACYVGMGVLYLFAFVNLILALTRVQDWAYPLLSLAVICVLIGLLIVMGVYADLRYGSRRGVSGTSCEEQRVNVEARLRTAFLRLMSASTYLDSVASTYTKANILEIKDKAHQALKELEANLKLVNDSVLKLGTAGSYCKIHD